jgi:hypothetical protein
MTHGAGLQSRHAIEILTSGCNLIERTLDFCELNTFSCLKEQAYSQIVQPEHLSESQETSFHLDVSARGTAAIIYPSFLV